jgi:hypothetical protein
MAKISGLKLASAIAETVLAIPILGAAIIIGFIWIPLALMLCLHIVTLILTKEDRKQTGSILGIVTSCIAWIPFVGWVMHIITAVFLWKEAFKELDEYEVR